MAGGGSKTRRGGRPKGGLNKATIERAKIAEQIVARAEMRGEKLAKEVLSEFMLLFAGMAAVYQPLPPGAAAPPGRAPNEGKFLTYATLARDTAAKLAPFQSPTFRAVQVSAAAPTPPKTIDGNVVSLNDPIGASKVYMQIVQASKKSA